MNNEKRIEYLKNQIYGLRNNPKRLVVTALNFIQGQLISMKDDDLPLNEYWGKWAKANSGINLLIMHFNSETETGQRLIQLFLFIQNKMKEKPDNALFQELINLINTIKGGFYDNEPAQN